MTAIAQRMEQIPFSTIRTMLERVSELEQQGAEIIHLEMGRPDFDTPAHIKQACYQALEQGLVHYTSNFGILPLRQAIAAKLARENHCHFVAQTDILVTAGVSQGIAATMMALLDPGDEVLLMTPVFPAYLTAVRMAGGIPVFVPVFSENNFQPMACDLQRCLTSRTKMIVITTPGNPSGVVLNRATLQGLADFAIAHDLLVLSDEIYEKIIYEGCEHVSIASLAGMRERTITVNGFSKSYAMTGWRLGYVAADARFIEAIVRITQNTSVCPTTFVQWAGVVALEGSQRTQQAMVVELGRRRLLMIDKLSQMPALSFVRPQGAMYLYVNISETGMHAAQFADELLLKANIAVAPWDDRHIRIAYSNAYEQLELALQRLQLYLESLDL